MSLTKALMVALILCVGTVIWMPISVHMGIWTPIDSPWTDCVSRCWFLTLGVLSCWNIGRAK